MIQSFLHENIEFAAKCAVIVLRQALDSFVSRQADANGPSWVFGKRHNHRYRINQNVTELSNKERALNVFGMHLNDAPDFSLKLSRPLNGVTELIRV